jgi:SAM-dependent methyltransferase
VDRSVYAIEAEVEQSHWWFVGRRRLFARELSKAGNRGTQEVLDVGSGTGSNLRMLRDLGFPNAVGLDSSEDAIRFCADKGLAPVRYGDICAMPFDSDSFDLVLATDVIEHVEDDGLALREVARVLRPGGKAIVTVPAFNSLWGLQDRVAHHRRRYRQRELRRLLEAAGLKPVRMYYFNYLLFGPIWLARRLVDILGLKLESEAQLNTPAVNFIFSAIFRLDTWTAPLVRPPLGVSILALVSK